MAFKIAPVRAVRYRDDPDSEIVAFDYDDRDDVVREMIRFAVNGCRRSRRHPGICGQAPSDYPAMAQFPIEIRVDSISLNPDTALKTAMQGLELEKNPGRKPRS